MRHEKNITNLVQPATDEQYESLVAVVTDINGAFKNLPEVEQRLYIDAQQSVIAARIAGERLSRLIFIR